MSKIAKHKKTTAASPTTAFTELVSELEVIRIERIANVKTAQEGVDIIDRVLNDMAFRPAPSWPKTVFLALQLAGYRITARKGRTGA